MTVEIKVNAKNPIEKEIIQEALQNIASNAELETLQFLSQLSKMKDINKKLLSNKNTIKLALKVS